MQAPISTSPATAVRKRVRLSPELRSGQILDAALLEFSANGYAATRMEDIARRSGLSKAGLYAHYSSKEAVFESLLSRVLAPAARQWHWHLPAAASRAERVDALIEQTYAQLNDPGVLALLRLLLIEGNRMPALLQAWRDNVLMAQFADQYALLFEQPATPQVLKAMFSLIHAPAVHVALGCLVFGDDQGEAAMAGAKAAHRHMLMVLLESDDFPLKIQALLDAPGQKDGP